MATQDESGVGQAIANFKRQALLPIPTESTPWLIGLSGGVDSTALLHALVQHYPAQYLIAVHVHHGLMPQADAWLSFCEQQAEQSGVRFIPAPVGPPPDRFSDGLENWARDARRRAFADVAVQTGAGAIVLAQHADDQIETILQRLLRGAGADGLAGMARVSERDRLWVARPMLALRRASIQAYVEHHGLAFVDDPSNDDLALTRNRLRHQVLPDLERACPGLGESLLRSARHLAQTNRVLDALLFDGDDPPDSLDRDRLRQVGPDVASLMLRAWLGAHQLRAPDEKHLAEMIVQLIDGDSVSAQISHDGKTLRRYRHEIRCEPVDGPIPASTELIWRGEPFMDLPDYGGRIEFSNADVNDADRLTVSASMLNGQTIAVTPLRMSARMREHVGGPRRSLRLLCQEHGIAPWHRRRLPMLSLGAEVLFVAGLGLTNAQFAGEPAGGDPVRLRWQAL